MATSTPVPSTSTSTKHAHQPLASSVRPLLDPEYVAFHDSYLQYVEPDDQRPWHPVDTRARRHPGNSAPVPVAQTRDIQLPNFPVRTFWPPGERPAGGWPLFVWFHGGGWAIGSIESENDFCTRMCRDAACVVVTVGYRLAPEHPFPIPVDDALEALVWVHGKEGSKTLDIDPSRIAIGGTSAGGNLSIVTALQAAHLPTPIPLVFQLLIVPVIDNTATTATTWATRTSAPWLTPARMLWYRNMYLLNPSDASDWRASPNLAQEGMLARLPRTWVGIAEQDLLAPEAWAFVEQLRGVGGEVEVVEYKGMTHTILAMNGIFSKGKQLVIDAGAALKKAFERARVDREIK